MRQEIHKEILSFLFIVYKQNISHATLFQEAYKFLKNTTEALLVLIFQY